MMFNNDVAFHLDILGRTSAGTLFGNLDEKVVVIRWESHADYVEAALLSKMLDNELTACGAETLFYDMRRIGLDEGSTFDATMRLAAISNPALKQVAWLGCHPELLLPDTVERALLIRGVKSCWSDSFLDATAMLTGGTMRFYENWQEEIGAENFEATYGGSCYNMPELKTTVLRSAGNYFDLPLAQDMYKKAFRLHARTEGSAFILDSSAIPPILDLNRYTFAFDAFIRPIFQTCKVEQLIHMRVGDPILPPGVTSLQVLAQAFKDVQFAETSSMADAIKLIRATRGLSTRPAMLHPSKNALGSSASGAAPGLSL